jgi:HAD superfamily hydrolase (TIGR01549 family)
VIAHGYKAVVFDVDGTLYRLRPLQRAMQIHFLRGHWHRPREAWQVHRAVSAYRRAIDDLREVPADGRDLKVRQIEIAARISSLPEESVRERVRRWMEEEPLAFLRRFQFEGIVEVLGEFKGRGVRLGVFSDFPARNKLSALGIEEFFDVVLSAHDAGVQRFKPEPRGLRIALEQLGVEPEEAIYVGDRPSIDGVAA